MYNVPVAETPRAQAVPTQERSVHLGLWDGVLSLGALAVIVAFLLIPPHSLLDKADDAAYAVCHRIADRTFFIAGRQLPLCARCSGTYLGALAGFVVLGLRRRGRAGNLPARKHLVVLALFLLAWAFDGVNSYLTLFPVLPHLYQPHNLLRLVTGTLEGLTIAALTTPVVNLSLWAVPDGRPSIGSWRDLAWMLVGGALVIGLVSSEWPLLLYPLALTSGVMVVLLVGGVNAMLLLVLLHREGRSIRWLQTVPPLLAGCALAMVELAAIGLARAALTQALGLPF